MHSAVAQLAPSISTVMLVPAVEAETYEHRRRRAIRSSNELKGVLEEDLSTEAEYSHIEGLIDLIAADLAYCRAVDLKGSGPA